MQFLCNCRMKTAENSESEHIYQTLFLEGAYSDVTVKIFGKDWKLHKKIIAKVKQLFS